MSTSRMTTRRPLLVALTALATLSLSTLPAGADSTIGATTPPAPGSPSPSGGGGNTYLCGPQQGSSWLTKTPNATTLMVSTNVVETKFANPTSLCNYSSGDAMRLQGNVNASMNCPYGFDSWDFYGTLNTSTHTYTNKGFSASFIPIQQVSQTTGQTPCTYGASYSATAYAPNTIDYPTGAGAGQAITGVVASSAPEYYRISSTGQNYVTQTGGLSYATGFWTGVFPSPTTPATYITNRNSFKDVNGNYIAGSALEGATTPTNTSIGTPTSTSSACSALLDSDSTQSNINQLFYLRESGGATPSSEVVNWTNAFLAAYIGALQRSGGNFKYADARNNILSTVTASTFGYSSPASAISSLSATPTPNSVWVTFANNFNGAWNSSTGTYSSKTPRCESGFQFTGGPSSTTVPVFGACIVPLVRAARVSLDGIFSSIDKETWSNSYYNASTGRDVNHRVNRAIDPTNTNNYYVPYWLSAPPIPARSTVSGKATTPISSGSPIANTPITKWQNVWRNLISLDVTNRNAKGARYLGTDALLSAPSTTMSAPTAASTWANCVDGNASGLVAPSAAASVQQSINLNAPAFDAGPTLNAGTATEQSLNPQTFTVNPGAWSCTNCSTSPAASAYSLQISFQVSASNTTASFSIYDPFQGTTLQSSQGVISISDTLNCSSSGSRLTGGSTSAGGLAMTCAQAISGPRTYVLQPTSTSPGSFEINGFSVTGQWVTYTNTTSCTNRSVTLADGTSITACLYPSTLASYASTTDISAIDKPNLSVTGSLTIPSA